MFDLFYANVRDANSSWSLQVDHNLVFSTLTSLLFRGGLWPTELWGGLLGVLGLQTGMHPVAMEMASVPLLNVSLTIETFVTTASPPEQGGAALRNPRSPVNWRTSPFREGELLRDKKKTTEFQDGRRGGLQEKTAAQNKSCVVRDDEDHRFQAEGGNKFRKSPEGFSRPAMWDSAAPVHPQQCCGRHSNLFL